MLLDDVDAGLTELAYQPLTSADMGHLLYQLVLREGIDDVLELGFGHGTSTAYMAAALHEKGSGSVTTLDLATALNRRPNLDTVLGHLGLEDQVRPVLAARSYTWELMRLLERQFDGHGITRCFDFCFIDGAHTWDADGLAFLLVDRLLREDRWVGFDDVNWTFASSAALKDTERVQNLPDDERRTPQLRNVIELLVRPAGYALRIFGNYAFAYKPHPWFGVHRSDVDDVISSDRPLFDALAFAPLRGRPANPVRSWPRRAVGPA